jgi:hypothetical protein
MYDSNILAIDEDLKGMQKDLIAFLQKHPKSSAATTIKAFVNYINTQVMNSQEGQQFLQKFNSNTIGPTYYGELVR